MPSSEKPSFIALYLDEDLTYKLAEALRERGFDAIAAYEVGNIEGPDQVHLEFAAGQGRALVTYNAKAFCRYLTNGGRPADNIMVSSFPSNWHSVRCFAVL